MPVTIDTDMGDYQVLLSEMGRRLKERRQEARLSQSELAESAGLSRITIVNIEGGQNPVKLSTLWTLANNLNVPLKDLIPEEPGKISASPFSAADAEYANRVAASAK